MIWPASSRAAVCGSSQAENHITPHICLDGNHVILEKKVMPEELILTAARRHVVGRAVKQLRRENLVPVNLYGGHIESRSLQVDEPVLKKMLAQAGETRLINLRVKGEEDPHIVLVREVQRDILTRSLLHVDFYEVVMTERLRASVPLNFVGTSPLVALGQAVLNEVLSVVEVECLPADIPASIDVDTSVLDTFDAVIRVGDLPVQENVEILINADETVAGLLAVTVEEEAEEALAKEALEGLEAEHVEVVAKGKAARGEEVGEAE